MARNEEMKSVTEAASVLGISPHTLRAWIRSRRISFHRIGRRILFAPPDLHKFIRAHRVPAHNNQAAR
jgi:excisionase family DNA binding protein